MIFYDSDVDRPSLARELKELYQYRDLVILMTINSVKTRYKRSVLGVVWTLLNPLLYMSVMTIAFTAVFRSALPHYPVYVLTGLICWNLFTQTTLHAMNHMIFGGSLIRRIYFPRTIFALATLGNAGINFCLSMAPLAAIILLLGHPIRASWAFVPIAMGLMGLFSFGASLLMSILAVFFADIIEIHQALVQILFFLTPIMYPQSIVPARYSWCHRINPFYWLIEVFRRPIYDGVWPSLHSVLAASFCALAALSLGWTLFLRKADELAYHV